MESANTHKVVRGSCAAGFKDVTPLQSYALCVAYLRAHRDEVGDGDHYSHGLDLMDADGRLASWVL